MLLPLFPILLSDLAEVGRVLAEPPLVYREFTFFRPHHQGGNNRPRPNSDQPLPETTDGVDLFFYDLISARRSSGISNGAREGWKKTCWTALENASDILESMSRHKKRAGQPEGDIKPCSRRDVRAALATMQQRPSISYTLRMHKAGNCSFPTLSGGSKPLARTLLLWRNFRPSRSQMQIWRHCVLQLRCNVGTKCH